MWPLGLLFYIISLSSDYCRHLEDFFHFLNTVSEKLDAYVKKSRQGYTSIVNITYSGFFEASLYCEYSILKFLSLK
jgi:hypothetical protein